MKGLNLLKTLGLFLLLALWACKDGPSTTAGVTAENGAKTGVTNRTLQVVDLSGSGYELGRQHGRQLRAEIAEIVSKWKENTAGILNRDAEEVLTEFFEYARFEDAIKTHAPELYEEVRGIADGSGQAFRDVFVLNLLDEFWVYVDNPENHHCSDMGVPAQNGKPTWIAQNMDIETYTDGHQTLFRLQRGPGRPAQLILSHPGLIALNGMNETGIGVVVNTIMQLKSAPEGLPVAFMVRKILGHSEGDTLLEFIQNTPHASGQNYILGIRDSVYDFEASANRVVRYNPQNPNGSVYHTNHPVVNTDLKPWYAAFAPNQENPQSQPYGTNSYIRFSSLENRFKGNADISDASIMRTLRSKDDPDNPVCRNAVPGMGGFTFASTLMTLTGKPTLQITAGPPDESEYRAFGFEDF